MTDYELKVLLTVICAAMIFIRACVEAERRHERAMEGYKSDCQRHRESVDKFMRDAFPEVDGNE